MTNEERLKLCKFLLEIAIQVRRGSFSFYYARGNSNPETDILYNLKDKQANKVYLIAGDGSLHVKTDSPPGKRNPTREETTAVDDKLLAMTLTKKKDQ